MPGRGCFLIWSAYAASTYAARRLSMPIDKSGVRACFKTTAVTGAGARPSTRDGTLIMAQGWLAATIASTLVFLGIPRALTTLASTPECVLEVSHPLSHESPIALCFNPRRWSKFPYGAR